MTKFNPRSSQARKMPADHFVGDLKEAAIRAVRAFDLRLFADATNPFIGAGRRVAGLPGFPTLETAGINILPSPEQRSKQLDLGRRRRMVCDRVAGLFQNDCCLRTRLCFAATVLVNGFHAGNIDNSDHSGEFVFGAGSPQFRSPVSFNLSQFGNGNLNFCACRDETACDTVSSS